MARKYSEKTKKYTKTGKQKHTDKDTYRKGSRRQTTDEDGERKHQVRTGFKIVNKDPKKQLADGSRDAEGHKDPRGLVGGHVQIFQGPVVDVEVGNADPEIEDEIGNAVECKKFVLHKQGKLWKSHFENILPCESGRRDGYLWCLCARELYDVCALLSQKSLRSNILDGMILS